MLRMENVVGLTGLSKSAIYDWSNPKSPRHDPNFPQRFKLGRGTAVGWKEHEIQA